MFLKDCHRFFLEEMKLVYEAAEAAAITTLVFEDLAGIPKKTIITHPNQTVDAASKLQLDTALQRLKKLEPVQYVIGYTLFCNLRFKVSGAVLIPRPETEKLVHEVIGYVNEHSSRTLLDVGTGSGCIPISIKTSCPDLKVTAVDVSYEAINIAKENNAAHATKVQLFKNNFLDETGWNTLPTFDVIVSNPPYIPASEIASMHKNVTDFEPHLALFVPDANRFIFYEKIAAFGLKHLSGDGCIFVETHEDYANEVADIFNSLGYKTKILKDFFEKDRMVIATRYQ